MYYSRRGKQRLDIRLFEKIGYFQATVSAPNSAPSTVLMIGLVVNGHMSEAHLPK